VIGKEKSARRRMEGFMRGEWWLVVGGEAGQAVS
jgi:hypothetical protein